MPHVEGTLVTMCKNGVSTRAEHPAIQAERIATNRTHPHLKHAEYITATNTQPCMLKDASTQSYNGVVKGKQLNHIITTDTQPCTLEHSLITG